MEGRFCDGHHVLLPRCGIVMSACIPNPSLTFIRAARGNIAPSPSGVSLGVFRWATDAIGTFALTLTNLVIGSRIHIETQVAGTTLHDSVVDSTDETIVLSAYSSGSPYNDLRIKVRKGTGTPTYKPFETLATAIVGAHSIYVGQIQDE